MSTIIPIFIPSGSFDPPPPPKCPKCREELPHLKYRSTIGGFKAFFIAVGIVILIVQGIAIAMGFLDGIYGFNKLSCYNYPRTYGSYLVPGYWVGCKSGRFLSSPTGER